MGESTEDVLSESIAGCPPTGDGERYAAGETIAALLSFTSICLHELGSPKRRVRCIELLEMHNPLYGQIVRAACRMQKGIGESGGSLKELWTP